MKKTFIIFLSILLTITLSACADQDNITFELTDNGFTAIDIDEDISEYVEVESNVDATTAGDYTVDYVLSYKNVNKTITRDVTVLYPSNSCYYIANANEFQCSKVWSSYLNTVVKLSIFYHTDMQQDSAIIFDDIDDILQTYNNLSDKYKLYDGYTNIKTINDNPTDTHIIDQKLFDLITFSLDHQEEVNNLFNIALGPVLKVWHDYRDNCQLDNICEVPTFEELSSQDQYTNPNDITLNEDELSITLKQNMSLDIGGVSKGYISGVITDYLDSLSLEAYLLNNGESNVSIGGTHPTRDEGVFLIGITNPDYDPRIHDVTYFAAVKLSDGNQLVTSGDYQQFYTVDGEIYHHIIHPETLYPERYMRSVSIIFDDPALGDLYSTAIFLMPIEEGLSFVNSIDGLEAIWYDLNGDVFYSDNFEDTYLLD